MNLNVIDPGVLKKCPCCKRKYTSLDLDFEFLGCTTRFHYLCPDCGAEVLIERVNKKDSVLTTYQFMIYKD